MTIISDKARLGNVLWTLHVSNSWAKFGQFEIVQQGTPLWASKGAMANWLIGIPIVDYIIISMVSGLGTTLCPNHHVQFRRRGWRNSQFRKRARKRITSCVATGEPNWHALRMSCWYSFTECIRIYICVCVERERCRHTYVYIYTVYLIVFLYAPIYVYIYIVWVCVCTCVCNCMCIIYTWLTWVYHHFPITWP